MNKNIFSLVSSIVDYEVAGIFFNDKDDKKKKILYLSFSDLDLTEEVRQTIQYNFFNFVNGEIETRSDYCSNEVFEKKNVTEQTSIINDISVFNSKILIPLIYAGKVLGGICLYHRDSNKLNPSKIFDIILNELKILMRIKWLNSETKYLSITDGLTGLYNRRYLQQTIDVEYSRAKRYSHDLSFAMFDIDNFKKLNDTYGHQFGDRVLAQVSRIIKNSIRKTDYAARYGGEEIAVILPETELNSAKIPLERIRKKIEDYDFKIEDISVKVTVSVGIASILEKSENHEELMNNADKALYKAKQTGRNKVEVYQASVN